MSGDGYKSYSSYLHRSPSTTETYPAAVSSQTWNEWHLQQQYMQNYARSSATYTATSLNHNSHSSSTNHNSQTNNHNNFRNKPYHNSSTHTNRPYYRNRYNNNSNNQYSGNQQHGSNWQRNQSNYKRHRVDSSENEPQLKTAKKKKKPLSQNVPNKKEWTIEEAQRALAIEKELNKKSKNALIIKFPDHELNKDIVAQFHPSIENVHFQQPCTPRFCFVTVKESEDPEKVISVLNSQKFGEGFLSVEYKKDREEDQAISAEDIDPLTLYVGNLAQEITKDDMVTMYPNCRRIDIGFAKKMKFTRYAFVGFRFANESIEAFQRTHSKQMYSKSLIVRFRRLHGTVGMPGESKPQNPPKNKDDYLDASHTANTAANQSKSANPSNQLVDSSNTTSIPNTVVANPTSTEMCDEHSNISDIRVKQEQPSPNDSGDDSNHTFKDFGDSIMPGCISEHWTCPPIINEEIYPTIKIENEKIINNLPTVKPEMYPRPIFRIKHEAENEDDANFADDINSRVSHNITQQQNLRPRIGTDFGSLYDNMVNRKSIIDSFKKRGY